MNSHRMSPQGLACFLLTLLWSAANLHGQATPRINIQPTGPSNVRVEWPVGDGLYSLEQLDAFDGVSQWRPVSQAASVVTPNYRLNVSVTNQVRFYRLRLVAQPDPGTAPNPATVAPPPPTNVVQSFAGSTAFLYSGSNPVQIGVGPGTIVPARASVVRGKVKKRDGSALAGVHVRILNHPEFGFTYTRADGMFDLAVNGGLLYTVDFQLRGYCPAQRQVEAPNQDFRCLEDLILIGSDPISTSVAFGTNAPLQIARSSTNTDLAGTRSAKLLFPPGTCANLILPDGSTQDCGVLTIRATEFTVGPDGPKAMPAPLPPSSAYTYAVELSSDEAVAAGANTIRFNQPVRVYVDNFLGLQPGGLVPNGYYDRELAAWVPDQNGVVIKILGTNGGLAQLDVDGDGFADDSAALMDAAFTTAELQHLAAAYPVGKTLWRMPVAHFSAWDFNCPDDPLPKQTPNRPGDTPNKKACKDCEGVGGSVETAQQIFNETIPLVGVPMDLHYSSARVPGYKVDSELDLPLTGTVSPPGLVKVGVNMEIAGRSFDYNYSGAPNLTGGFTWDGYDAYGRPVGDTRRAYFTLTYYYPLTYGVHDLARQGVVTPPLFGNYGQFSSSIGHNEAFAALFVKFDRLLTIPDHRKLGLGGWSLTPLHRYDPAGRILYRGDGTIEPSSSVNAISVLETSNLLIQRMAAAPDGSFFVVDVNGAILRLTTAGLLVSVTSGPPPFDPAQGILDFGEGALRHVDGAPASRVWLHGTACWGLAVAPDGSLYYRTRNEILRLTPDGIMHVVLGTLAALSYPEDGSLASESYASPDGQGKGLGVAADGTVYYADTWNLGGKIYDFIRKVAPDGRIYTIAGRGGRNPDVFNPFADTQGYGAPAIGCVTTGINDIGVGPDGSVYFSDTYNVNRILPGGILTQVMNGRPLTMVGYPGKNDAGPNDHEIDEGKPAIRPDPPRGGGSSPAIYMMRVGADGVVYMGTGYGADQWFIWKVDDAGLFKRVAGRWFGPYQPGLTSLESNLGILVDFSVDRKGAFTMFSGQRLENGSIKYTLRRTDSAFPGFDALELPVASQDGSELYIFNAAGLHLRTLDTLTRTVKWLFTYDANNLVTQMRDANGLVTTIQRNASGAPIGIVGPYGQRTALAVDANGFLASVVNPANETVQLVSSANGLLQSLSTPRGNTEHLAYDNLGRVVQAVDAAGNTRTWTRSGQSVSFTIHDEAPSGSASDTKLDLLSNGDTLISRKFEDGTTNTELYSGRGDRVLNNSDGSVTTSRIIGDPRFPSQTTVPSSVTLALPGGLVSSANISRSVTLADPADALSLTNATVVTTINGNNYTSFYTASNRTEVVTTPEGRQSTTVLDEQGRAVRSQVASFSPVEIAYDSAGRITNIIDQTSTGPRQTGFIYDDLGRLTRIVDPLDRTNSIIYDAAGRPTSSMAPDGSVVSIGYDADSNVTGITPPGRPAHQFSYNNLGLLTKYTPPVVSSNDDSVRYQYDADKRGTRVDLPDGQAVAFTYETSNQLKQMVLGDGPTLQFKYNSASGLLTNITSSDGNGVSYAYQGSLITDTIWSGVVTGKISMQYNADFQPVRQTINGGSPVDYVYDRDGFLIKAGNMTLTRDPNSGAVVSTKLGVVSDSRQFNENGLLTNCTATVNDTNLWTYLLAYDVLDRITNKVETLSGVTRTFRYVYDLAGRLSQVWENGVLATTYTYDANGNRLSRNNETGSYDAQDRLVSYNGATYTYSPNGTLRTKVLSGLNTTYTYDAGGALTYVQLPSSQPVQYVLNPLGQRVAKKVNGAFERGWLWNGDLIMAEIDANSNLTKRFIYADSGTTPSFMVVGTNSYRILGDERGSVRLVINVADGNVAQQLSYDEFGRLLQDTNPGLQPFGFAGGLYDSQAGFVRFGARDYDPETGRWTDRDPVLFLGSAGNLFGYCEQDPVNHVDPSGAGPDVATQTINALLEWAAAANKAGDTRLANYVFREALEARRLIKAGKTCPWLANAARAVAASKPFQRATFRVGTEITVNVAERTVAATTVTLATEAAGQGGARLFARGALGTVARFVGRSGRFITGVVTGVLTIIIIPEQGAE